MQLWQIHNAEQLILDDMESNPEKYEGKKLTELTDSEEYNKENSVEYTKTYYQNSLLPKMIVVCTFLTNSFLFIWWWIYLTLLTPFWQKVSVKDLDLEAALIERQVGCKLDLTVFFSITGIDLIFGVICTPTLRVVSYWLRILMIYVQFLGKVNAKSIWDFMGNLYSY